MPLHAIGDTELVDNVLLRWIRNTNFANASNSSSRSYCSCERQYYRRAFACFRKCLSFDLSSPSVAHHTSKAAAAAQPIHQPHVNRVFEQLDLQNGETQL